MNQFAERLQVIISDIVIDLAMVEAADEYSSKIESVVTVFDGARKKKAEEFQRPSYLHRASFRVKFALNCDGKSAARP